MQPYLTDNDRAILNAVPADQIARWEKEAATKLTKERTVLISERSALNDRDIAALPALQEREAETRLAAEIAKKVYLEAETEHSKAFNALLNASSQTDFQRLRIEKTLRTTAPAIIPQKVREWENEFSREISPSVINRNVGKWDANGNSLPEIASNHASITAFKVALRKIIEIARTELPLQCASEKEALDRLNQLYAGLPKIEPPRFQDTEKPTPKAARK